MPTAAQNSARPTLAVWKFASCDGCQLTLLDCEDELLAVTDRVQVQHFLEASSEVRPGPYDISLVEGSITTARDRERIRQVRERSRVLITIGACATAGGIQALRNFADVKEFTSVVYARPDYIETLATSTPISDHVPVDFELRGCPIDKRQLLEVLTASLVGRAPHVPDESVCTECKRQGRVCVSVAHRHAVPGPGHACRVRGAVPVVLPRLLRLLRPVRAPNTASLGGRLELLGTTPEQIQRLFRTFNPTFPVPLPDPGFPAPPRKDVDESPGQ